MHGDTIAGNLPSVNRTIVTGADNLTAIGRERYTIDVLRIASQYP